jgi:hypothetical protein
MRSEDAFASLSTMLSRYLAMSIPISGLNLEIPPHSWGVEEFKSLAKYLEDRPLLLYIIQHLQHSGHQGTSSMLKEYFGRLEKSPAEFGWVFLQYWIKPENPRPFVWIEERNGGPFTEKCVRSYEAPPGPSIPTLSSNGVPEPRFSPGNLASPVEHRDWCFFCVSRKTSFYTISLELSLFDRILHDLFLAACQGGHYIVVHLLLESPFRPIQSIIDSVCLSSIRSRQLPLAEMLLKEAGLSSRPWFTTCLGYEIDIALAKKDIEIVQLLSDERSMRGVEENKMMKTDESDIGTSRQSSVGTSPGRDSSIVTVLSDSWLFAGY